ncbi:MAG TPA: serine/threonine-protein kinase [Solirubrobacteraceae bacterium]|nr:serine/threonine-protein kinase [Solirubrobacteraceae bacterium]
MDRAPDSTGSPRRVVGRYEILSEIGRGSMGVVYLAYQRNLDRMVALKELNSVHAHAPNLSDLFVRESRLAASLSHPNVVTVFESFETDETPYIVMEYLPRGSLRPWVGELTLAQLAGVLEGLLSGLAGAESLNIVHRDLKPENIMVTTDGRVKIADFGIAKVTQSTNTASFMTTLGGAIGTPAYMAPEQALSRPIGPSTDLYAVGVMSYEQLAGRLPFWESGTPIEIALRHVNDPIPAILESQPDVDSRLSGWVERLLLKDPAERTPNALQAWEELEEIITDLLGPLWRRDARLPERAIDQPPMQADIRTRSAQPEVESRVLSYQRALESAPRSIRRAEPAQAKPPTQGSLAAADQPADGSPHEPPQAEREPGRPVSGERPRNRRWVAICITAALAAATGFAGAPSRGAARKPAPLDRNALTRSVQASYPSTWRAQTLAPATPGLQLDNPLVLVSKHSGAALLIGASATTSPTLLPAALLSIVPNPPRGEVVRLGSNPFYRYRNLRPRGAADEETIYAQPTTAGVILGVCLLPRAARQQSGVDCERIVGSLRLRSATMLELGPSRAYAARLNRAISKLNGTRSAAGAELAHASTAAAQEHAAAQLALAHTQAAALVRSSQPRPLEEHANAALAGALAKLARAYSTMVSAAHRHDQRSFDGARSSLTRATADLELAVVELRKLGYRFSS